MSDEKLNHHLSRISTVWTDLVQAHGGSAAGASEAQRRLLDRYGPAILRFLYKAVGDPDVAWDLYQEFALRLLRGAFRRADPGRGRFRDYLKTSLRHLIADRRAREQTAPGPLPVDVPAGGGEGVPQPDLDEPFLTAWRDELIRRAWGALAELERQSGQPLFSVLDFRTRNPGMPLAEMADRFAAGPGQRVTPAWVSKRLHLARERLKDLIVVEVAQSVEDPTPEALAEELLDLGLLGRCQSALERRRLNERRT